MGYKQEEKVVLTEDELIKKKAKGGLTKEETLLMAKLVKERMPRSRVDLYEKRVRKLSRQGYLVDTIWPEGTVHLIAGPSGVGKSTWLLKTIHDWEHGKPVMGFPSHPVPYVYLMCDRSEVDLQRTLNRMGLGEWHINAYSIESLGQDPFNLEPQDTSIEHLPDIFPWAKVFFIEAINWFYRNRSNSASKDYVDTLRFWSHVRDQFCTKDLTIIGTTHVPKMKQNEAYARPRDKVHGSVGQPAVAGTIILMDDDAKDRDKVSLTVCARDAKEFVVEYRRGLNGILELAEDATKIEDTGAFSLLDKRLNKLEARSKLEAPTIRQWYRELNVSKATMYRWLDAKLGEGRLFKIQKGEYQVGRVN